MSTLGIFTFRKIDSLLPPRLVSSPCRGELIGLYPGTVWRHPLSIEERSLTLDSSHTQLGKGCANDVVTKEPLVTSTGRSCP